MGAALQAPLILIGDKLGLYRAMGGWSAGVTPAETGEEDGDGGRRYVREWLNANAGRPTGAV